jgi:hypothetical protein
MISGECPTTWPFQKKVEHCAHPVKCFDGSHNHSEICCKCATRECIGQQADIPKGHGEYFPDPPLKPVRVKHTHPFDVYRP